MKFDTSRIRRHLRRRAAIALWLMANALIVTGAFAVPALHESVPQAEPLAMGRSSASPQAQVGERLIVVADDERAADALVRRASATDGALRSGARRDAVRMRVRPGEQPQDAVRRAQALPGVRFAEIDHVRRATWTPDDPMYSAQWAMPRVNAPAAWDTTRASQSVVIAVIDTGVQLDHPDLASRIDTVNAYDFVNDDSNASDDHDHGTAVAGAAAMIPDNSVGGASLGGGATILPVKVLDNTGSGWDSDVADGIVWAVDHGARIINLSLGGAEYSTYLDDAVQYARSHGAIVIAAAGNDAKNEIQYPAGCSGVIGVAATTDTDARASFSNRGSHVDMAAPGVNIFTSQRGDTYRNWSGTSFSTPIVAGAAALILTTEPSLAETRVALALTGSARDLGSPGRDDYFGSGLLDASAAVRWATDHTPPNTTASDSSSGWTNASSVSVSLAATDSGSGVGETRFATASPAPDTTYSEPFAVTAEGLSTVAFASVDRMGNEEPVRTRTVRIDRTAPVSSCDAAATYLESALISIAATDGLSGVAFTEYSLDGGAWTTGTSVAVSTAGTHTVQYRATDAAGNVEGTRAVTFSVAGLRRFEQTDSRIGYSGPWSTFVKSAMSGGSYAYLNAAGAVTLRFTGTGFDWITARAPAFGRARVTIDGGAAEFVDLYSPVWEYQATVLSKQGLSDGPHTVLIEWTGTRNAASTNTYVGVDMVSVLGTLVSATTPTYYEQTNTRISFSGAWATFTKSAMSGGSYGYLNSTGSATIAFRGTGFDWITAKSPAFGRARVTIDGGVPEIVDLYSPAWEYQATALSKRGLTDGIHTVVIEWTGTRNAASTNNYIGLDALTVLGVLENSVVPARYEQTDARIGYAGPWATFTKSAMSGGSYAYLNSTGSSTFNFSGTGFDWITAKSPAFGRARVTIDGGVPEIVDLYAQAWEYQSVVLSKRGLADGAHTVVIEWMGSRNTASTNTYVGLDAIEVISALP